MSENEMKSLETRLRSWRPRRPSATLKWRLLLARAAGVPRMVRVAGWLTPATACALLALVAMNSENALRVGDAHTPSILALLSNQSYAASVTGHQYEQNNLSCFTSDWTNASNSGFTPAFTPFRKQH